MDQKLSDAGRDFATEPAASEWRFARTTGDQPSLSEVHATVPVPVGGSWLRRLVAFSGPGYMVSVGYMDPGNWATDLAGGSKFGYTLLSVILLSNLMAILLQSLAARLRLLPHPGPPQARPAAHSPARDLLLLPSLGA